MDESHGFGGNVRQRRTPLACLLAFTKADVLHGTIQNCGADFFKPVPTMDTAEKPNELSAADSQPVRVNRIKLHKYARATVNRRVAGGIAGNRL